MRQLISLQSTLNRLTTDCFPPLNGSLSVSFTAYQRTTIEINGQFFLLKNYFSILFYRSYLLCAFCSACRRLLSKLNWKCYDNKQIPSSCRPPAAAFQSHVCECFSGGQVDVHTKNFEFQIHYIFSVSSTSDLIRTPLRLWNVKKISRKKKTCYSEA